MVAKGREMKMGRDLGEMIDTATTIRETGMLEIGPRPCKVKAEHRSVQMPVRMKPSTRALIESLADAEGVPIAEIVERAIAAYAKNPSTHAF